MIRLLAMNPSLGSPSKKCALIASSPLEQHFHPYREIKIKKPHAILTNAAPLALQMRRVPSRLHGQRPALRAHKRLSAVAVFPQRRLLPGQRAALLPLRRLPGRLQRQRAELPARGRVRPGQAVLARRALLQVRERIQVSAIFLFYSCSMLVFC